MEITREEFEKYLKVQIGGEINMLDVKAGTILTELNTAKYKYIIQNYNDLVEKYPESYENIIGGE